jgi:hypothetical protein
VSDVNIYYVHYTPEDGILLHGLENWREVVESIGVWEFWGFFIYYSTYRTRLFSLLNPSNPYVVDTSAFRGVPLHKIF